jgi:signal transduction histidine kinase
MLDKIKALEAVTAELNKNKNLLVDAERYSALGHMAAQLAHSIRNPITSIGGIARLLEKRTDDENCTKFLSMMIRESGRIETILDDLFNFVRDEKPEKEIQALYPLIRKSLMLFYEDMKKSSILYRLDLPSPDPLISIDAKHIQQMLLHLIRNCVEVMDSGGLLTVTCKQSDDTVTICIEDSGSDMNSSDNKRIYDPFYTTKTYGIGMGLTLVEKIVAEHDGSFSLQHGKLGGMTARIILPLQDKQSG